MEKKSEINAKYKMVPPDGGWGYVVIIAVVMLNYAMTIPMTSFGLIYGKFLASVGDETTGITIANGLFNTLMNFTGILTSFLLQKFSYRKVCLLGTIMYIVGAVDLIFVKSRMELFFTFGVLQGVGYGLIFPGSFTAFNCYFDKKLNTMMGIAQGFMIGGSIAFPPITIYLMNKFGYKICTSILTGFLLLMFPSVWALHPVKWYLKKEPIDIELEEQQPLKSTENLSDNQRKSLREELSAVEYPKRKQSIISLGDKSMVVDNTMGTEEKTANPSKIIDFSLLKSLKFLNMSLGLALSFSADVSFLPMLPVLLTESGFDSADMAAMMVGLYVCDVVSRMILSAYCAFYKVNNRYLFLGGTILLIVSRGAFFYRDDYMWKMILLGSMGFLRTYIQVPYALVIADEYKEDFATAFSLTLFICGIVNSILGPSMSYVKTATESNAMVVHLLSMVFLLSAVLWMIEITYNFLKKK